MASLNPSDCTRLPLQCNILWLKKGLKYVIVRQWFITVMMTIKINYKRYWIV